MVLIIFANIQLEATVVSIINAFFLCLFVYAGIRHARMGAKENCDDIDMDIHG